jgi:hypothetical protein
MVPISGKPEIGAANREPITTAREYSGLARRARAQE